MANRSMMALLAAVAATALFGTSAGAAVQSKCLVSKNTCMSKKAGSLLKCHQKAETPGKPAEPNADGCIEKAQDKFDGTPNPSKGCFEKLESKAGNDCISFNDTAAAEAKVDDCVDKLVQAIDPGTVTQTKCGVGKKKCVAKKLKSILKCYQKAETPGKPMDPNADGCIDEAQAKFDGGTDPTKGCFVKLESKTGNDCQPPMGNQAALEAIVDSSCAAAFVALLENPTTTSTTVTSTTTTLPGTTSTTTIVTTTSTTTTTSPGSPAFLDFTNAAPGGVCGNTKDGMGMVIKNLTCGGLNLGGGGSIVPEGPTPDGSVSRYAIACGGSNCTVGPTTAMPPVNSADPDCTNTGCNFGTPLPIPNPTIPTITTCVMNSWQSPASGTLDLGTGASSQNIPLDSDIYLTGNLAQPCPRCSATGTPGSPGTGTCDRGPRTGLVCTTLSSLGLTRDCPTGGTDGSHPCTPGGGACIDGSHVGVINVNLYPLSTDIITANSDPSGIFCAGQTGAGCFGSAACRSITENGSPAGPLTPGTPTSVTLASYYCIAATMNGLVDASANLPGPGAVTLRGTLEVN